MAEEDTEQLCSICMDNIEPPNILSLECNHTYHATCIAQWFRKKSTCPLCRRDEDEALKEAAAMEEERLRREIEETELKLKQALARKTEELNNAEAPAGLIPASEIYGHGGHGTSIELLRQTYKSNAEISLWRNWSGVRRAQMGSGMATPRDGW